MVFVEVGSPYILAGAQTVFSCRSVWQIFMSMQCYYYLHALGRRQYLELGLGYISIGLSILRRGE